MKKPTFNPFLVAGYQSPIYFCDRKEETRILVEAIRNKRNVTLFALRRMGKTGLADHVGHELKRRDKYNYLYSDVYHTYNMETLLAELSKAIVNLISAKKSHLEKLIGIFKRVRPLISFDPITGTPQLELNVRNEKEAFNSLEELFLYLDNLNTPSCWVIDEFQQISTFSNADSLYKLLRKIVQRSKNIQFIFSGSHSNMLLSLFKKSTQPFYNSTQLLELKEIGQVPYSQFINKHFKKAGKKIQPKAIEAILKLTHRHTWYVQMICNRLFQNSDDVNLNLVDNVISEICKEQEIVFYRYRQLMAKGQWNLLKAIAKEGAVVQITSSSFLRDHHLNGSASVLRALTKLLKDEFVVELFDGERSSYRLNDIFLMIWIQSKYG